MILAGVAVAILAIEISISSIGSDTGSGSGSAPECTVFADKNAVKVIVLDCEHVPDDERCRLSRSAIDTNITDITSIRASLQTLLSCDLDLDKSYFKVKEVERNVYEHETEYTALMVAAHYDLVDIAETLLTNGADPNIEYGRKVNALAVAASHGHTDVVAILADNGADITEAFHIAAAKGQADIVADLLDRGVNINDQGDQGGYNKMTALMTAAMLGHKEVFDLLIEKGANMDLQCDDGNTALIYSLFNVYPGSKKTDSYFMTLLEHGADVGVKNSKGKTIIQKIYCRDDCDKYYHALVDHGANINHKDNDGRTALMLVAEMAAEYGSPPYHNTAALIKWGADVNAQDLKGNTALMLVVSRNRRREDKGPLVSLLMDGGADPNIRNKESMAPLLLAAKDKEGTGVLTVLAEKGANLNLRTDEQMTALMYAALNGRQDNVETLLNHGADINAQSASGKTALHFAARSVDREMVSLLINWGADTCIRNKNGQTAWKFAYDDGMNGLAQYMKRRSGNC